MKTTLLLLPFLAVLMLILVNCNKEEVVKPASLTTLSVSNITTSTARSGGSISSDGGGKLSSRGVVWSNSPNPTAEQNMGLTINGTDTGEFTSEITGLTPGTTYYLRAYATNVAGMVYGNEQQFTTLGTLPEITTNDVLGVTSSSALSGGNITYDGGAAITSRGVVWSTSQNPSSESNLGITSDGSGSGSFASKLMGLSANTTYYLRAYAGNSAGTAYGIQLQFTTTLSIELPTVSTAGVSNISQYSATGGGNVTIDGGSPLIAKGIVWSTSPTPTLNNNEGLTVDGNGFGEFMSTMAELKPGTIYYVRAYASNNMGTGYGEEQIFTTESVSTGHNTQVIEVISPATGKTWMDRNLGATRAATSSNDAEAYGDLYQWGRTADGHHIRSSVTTTIPGTGDIPENGKYILVSEYPYDWRNPKNSNLWQGVDGINNPCPTGFRLPTAAELNEELQSWSSNDAAGAIASSLKLPLAGNRNYGNGALEYVEIGGTYWSSTADGSYTRCMYFSIGGPAGIGSNYRANGLSVRCIKQD